METRDGVKMVNGMTVYAVNRTLIMTGIVDTDSDESCAMGVAIIWQGHGNGRNYNTSIAYADRKNAEASIVRPVYNETPKPVKHDAEFYKNRARARRNCNQFTDDGDVGRDLTAELRAIKNAKRNYGC